VSERRRVELRLIRDKEHYVDVVMGAVAKAKVSVWIATANVKGLRVEALLGTRMRTCARARKSYVSVLEVMDGLAARGVELRMLHASVPSRAFREDLAAEPRLARGALAMRRCPRVHLKMIAVDGALLYLGSANFTGAGIGAKGDRRRNFEAGVLTDDDVLLDEMQATFDAIWTGKECRGCALRAVCPAPLDALARVPEVKTPSRSRPRLPKPSAR
jgi:phosphatidylserine/phosphatidylglycerophosphate/cardiolipin synthase-like enzyme